MIVLKVEISDIAITSIFTVLLIVGSISVFIVYEAWTSLNTDDRESSQSFAVEGVLEDAECSGTGEMKYLAYRAGYRVYTVSVSVDSSVSHFDTSFSLLFDSDDRLDSTLYTHMGEERIGEKKVDVWTHSEKGVDYTLYTSYRCTLEAFALVSSGYSLTGTLV